MLLGKKNSDSENVQDEQEQFVMVLIQQNKFNEALDMLNKSQESFFSLYNSAICSFFMNQFEQALFFITKAYTKYVPHNQSSILSAEVLFEFATKSLDSSYPYLEPISSRYADTFSNEVQENMMRLKLDILVELEKWDEIIKLKSDLDEKMLTYINVKEALELATKNTI